MSRDEIELKARQLAGYLAAEIQRHQISEAVLITVDDEPVYDCHSYYEMETEVGIN